ncbi:MAG: Hsp20 family protein, partial [Marivita sp.]
IAARQFQKSFVLADGVEVGAARIENGLLHVDLNRAVPDRIIQKIEISKG